MTVLACVSCHVGVNGQASTLHQMIPDTRKLHSRPQNVGACRLRPVCKSHWRLSTFMLIIAWRSPLPTMHIASELLATTRRTHPWNHLEAKVWVAENRRARPTPVCHTFQTQLASKMDKTTEGPYPNITTTIESLKKNTTEPKSMHRKQHDWRGMLGHSHLHSMWKFVSRNEEHSCMMLSIDNQASTIHCYIWNWFKQPRGC